MSKSHLYTIITCLIVFTITLCAKDQILGWYDFDTAVAADNDSGISDITPDTNIRLGGSRPAPYEFLFVANLQQTTTKMHRPTVKKLLIE